MKPQVAKDKPHKAPKAPVNLKTEALKYFLENELRGLYWLDTSWVSLTPYVNEHTTLPLLQQALQVNLQEAQEQMNLVAIIYSKMGRRLTGKKSSALNGLIRDAQSVLRQRHTQPINDVLILLAHQKIIGYKAAAYNTLYPVAKRLRYLEIAMLLKRCAVQNTKALARTSRLLKPAVNFD